MRHTHLSPCGATMMQCDDNDQVLGSGSWGVDVMGGASPCYPRYCTCTAHDSLCRGLTRVLKLLRAFVAHAALFNDFVRVFDDSQPGGALGLSSDLFKQWPGGYLARHLVLSVLLATLIQLLVHAFTLYKTFKLARWQQGL